MAAFTSPLQEAHKTAQASGPDASARPLPEAVTVVIPVYGSGPYLEAVIAALQRQSPPVAGIVISQSGEGDPSARFASVAGVAVLHSSDRLYAGAARNRGLALARTEWVAFIDEDIIVGNGWHAALLAAIARGSSDCIVGSIGCATSGGYWGTAFWYVEFGSVHPYLSARRISSGPSANLAAKCAAMRSIGGFPEDWRAGEDGRAQALLQEAGCTINFETSAAGYHHNREGMRNVLRYSFMLGRHSARLRRLHPQLGGGAAVRWPVLSLGLWIARMAQIYWRVFSARRGPIGSLLFHTPGILVSVLMWNAGFAAEAFRPAAMVSG